MTQPIFPTDQVHPSYTYSTTFNQFDQGQILTDINNFSGICVNMEHSYLGDLNIQITCPNGSTVTLKSNAANPNAGSAYLGIPNQIDSQDIQYQGIGWDYCWTPNPTYGIMSDVAQSYSGQSMPSGSYTSYEPLDNLIGCPLNGQWTLTIIDNWAIDDGWIFGWGIEFDSSFYYNAWSYQNTIASQTWSAPASYGEILSDDGNGNATGTYYCGQSHPNQTVESFVLTVTDDFGCTYDTTINVVVVSDTTNCCYKPALNIITQNQSVCGDSILLEASIEQGFNGVWTFSGPGTATLSQNIPITWVAVDTFGSYTFTYSSGQPGCDTSDVVTINFNEHPILSGHLIGFNDTINVYGYHDINSIYPNDSLIVSSSTFSMATDTGEYFFKFRYKNFQNSFPDVYYDNVFFWQLAQPVQMTCGDTAFLSIYHSGINVNASGIGHLQGMVYFENSQLPFESASIFLIDSMTGTIINSIQTDTAGQYEFFNVPDGHYYFTVDIFSLKQISTHYIEVGTGNYSINGLNFKIDTLISTRNPNGIYAVNGQNGISSNETIPISIFPTLSTGTIFIESPQEKITGIEIRNITGKTLKKLNTQGNRYQINLENQPSGIYFITVRTKESQFVRKVVLVDSTR